MSNKVSCEKTDDREDLSKMSCEEIKTELLAFMKERGPGVSFAELQKMRLGVEGEFWFGNEDINIWFWFNLSENVAQAFCEMWNDEIIVLLPVDPLIYFCDGIVPNFPVAKQRRAYKAPRWFPVVMNPKK